MTKPGERVRGSTTGRPVMVLLDLLGKRWALRLIWELRESQLTFREIQERCDGMSPSVLNQRLRDLREAEIVTHEEGGYRLTEEGNDLLLHLAPLKEWAERWAKRTKG